MILCVLFVENCSLALDSSSISLLPKNCCLSHGKLSLAGAKNLIVSPQNPSFLAKIAWDPCISLEPLLNLGKQGLCYSSCLLDLPYFLKGA